MKPKEAYNTVFHPIEKAKRTVMDKVPALKTVDLIYQKSKIKGKGKAQDRQKKVYNYEIVSSMAHNHATRVAKGKRK